MSDDDDDDYAYFGTLVDQPEEGMIQVSIP